ncbi:hypothetical protein ACIB24_00540 [Spongisporangium articulatum]|uniref:Uncharacterized protein n=1 Tax=Spongisporangium articulatum TaxID=3362603 RepID=A0ABW8AIU4_9ACTN
MAEKKTAGAFDIRTLIGGLLGLYGVVLTVMGLWFTPAAEKEKVDGSNLNLEVGIGLIVVAGVFITWALLRPIRVPAEPSPPQ